MKKQCLSFGKPLLAVALVFVTTLTLNAQEQRSGSALTSKIGVKGGVNFTNLYVDDVEDENVKLGFNLGLFAKLPVVRGFSIQPEILYSSKGSKLNYNSVLFGSGEYRFNLNYIEVPVLGVINLARNFNLHVGPYMGYLASANIKEEVDGGPNNTIEQFDEDDFNRFDYGLVGGFGFDAGSVTIGARYNYGLREVGEKNSVASSALSNSKNNGISLYVGFGF